MMQRPWKRHDFSMQAAFTEENAGQMLSSDRAYSLPGFFSHTQGLKTSCLTLPGSLLLSGSFLCFCHLALGFCHRCSRFCLPAQPPILKMKGNEV